MTEMSGTSNFDLIAEALDEGLISGEDLLRAFVNFHGNQLIEDDFIEFLNDEGFPIGDLEEDEEDEDED